MDISLNGNFIGNSGAVRDTPATSATPKAADAARTPRTTPNLTIGEGPAGLASAEPVADVPDSALTRDDELGKLFSAAFSLPAPAMPDFSRM